MSGPTPTNCSASITCGCVAEGSRPCAGREPSKCHGALECCRSRMGLEVGSSAYVERSPPGLLTASCRQAHGTGATGQGGDRRMLARTLLVVKLPQPAGAQAGSHCRVPAVRVCMPMQARSAQGTHPPNKNARRGDHTGRCPQRLSVAAFVRIGLSRNGAGRPGPLPACRATARSGWSRPATVPAASGPVAVAVAYRRQ